MSTFERLINVFDSVFDGDIDTAGITLQSTLFEDIGMNSIGMLYMAMALEEEFGIKFKNEDFAAIKTVSDVIEVIEKKA